MKCNKLRQAARLMALDQGFSWEEITEERTAYSVKAGIEKYGLDDCLKAAFLLTRLTEEEFEDACTNEEDAAFDLLIGQFGEKDGTMINGLLEELFTSIGNWIV